MAQIKTKAEIVNPYDFVAKIDNEKKRKEAILLIDMFKEITNHEPIMWGPSIIGFDKYEYKYESGHGGTMCKVGFSPRKPAHTIYLMLGSDEYKDLLEKLGKYKVSKGCLYINKFEDINFEILKQICENAYKLMTKKYG